MRDKSSIAELRKVLVRRRRARPDAIGRAPIRLALSLLILTSIITPSVSHADWITAGQFSEKAGIDSINRFIVIPDLDTNKLFGWRILPLGDINADGADDILIHKWLGDIFIDNPTYLFLGGHPPDINYDTIFNNFKYSLGMIGDVNDDGFSDIGVTPFPSLSFALHFGGPNPSDTPDFVIPNMWSWMTTAVDLDDDGELELPLSKNVNGGPVKIYHIGSNRDTIPEYVINDTAKGFGGSLATGDFNGDNYEDLAIAAFRDYFPEDSAFVKFYWGGPTFDTIADYVIRSHSNFFGLFMFSLGDFNADGYDDLYISGDGNDAFGIHFGGPQLSGSPNLPVNQWIYGGYIPPTSAAPAGDVNNDGYPDLIIGYSNDVQFVNEIMVYLGGPDADSIYDVRLENLQMPGDQSYFGEVVAGVGDFNGDGVDDFAVKSRKNLDCSNCDQAEVNFFAGWDGTPTDVPYEFERTLPTTYALNQNYPNPFNSSTTISFDLPRRDQVTLSIYDITGRKLRTLINNTLSAGSYSVTWDARNSKGESVSTGIYLCRLKSSSSTSSTRKLLLLK